MAQTVRITRIEGYNAVHMAWDTKPNPEDVRAAFIAIQEEMEKNTHPFYVVVDLADNVQFPVSETVIGALPVYRNDQLKAWLVVNPGALAKSIARTLNYITRRSNVHWFEDYPAAIKYLDVHTQIDTQQLPENN